MLEIFKGAKIMTADMRALINPDMQYELNKVYKYDGELKLCASGYHWSNSVYNAVTCFDIMGVCLYVDKCKCYLVEVSDTGQTIYGAGKNVSDNIRIVSEIPLDEVLSRYEEEFSIVRPKKFGYTEAITRFMTNLFFRYGYSDRYLYEEFVDLVKSDFTKEILTELDASEKREMFLRLLYQFVSKYFYVHNKESTNSSESDNKCDYRLSKDEIREVVYRMYESIGSLSDSIGIPLSPPIGYKQMRFARHLKGDDIDA